MTDQADARRQFLLRSAGFAAAGWVGSGSVQAAGTSVPGPGDAGRTEWNGVPRLFQFAKRAPLNAANFCPMPTAVWGSQQADATALNADVSLLNRRSYVRGAVEDARKACAEMLGVASPQRLVFVRNTTEANGTVINGLRLRADEEVVLWDQNHGSNNLAWDYRRQHFPYQCKTVVLPTKLSSKQAVVDAFVRALTPRTRVVSFSHLSNISGTVMPARELCAAIRQYKPDIHIHVDGAQSWGSMHVQLDQMGCDSYSASGHKWLCGPRGTGILVLSERASGRLIPSLYGYDAQYSYPEEGLQDGAARFENLGQCDNAAYGALRSAVEFHRQFGSQRVEQRIRELTQYTLAALDKAGIATMTPRDAALGHGVVVADLGSQVKAYGAFLALHNAGIASAFVQGYRILAAPVGVSKRDAQPTYLRMCPHIYNTQGDIDEAVAIVRRIHSSNFEIVREVIRFL